MKSAVTDFQKAAKCLFVFIGTPGDRESILELRNMKIIFLTTDLRPRWYDTLK